VIHYLDLVDSLLIAEAVTGIPAETPAKLPGIDLADSALHAPQAEFGRTEFLPGLPRQGRGPVFATVAYHPLLDGNKRSAWVALQEFMDRNGYSWTAPPVDEAEATVIAVASSEMSEEDFAAWLTRWISQPESPQWAHSRRCYRQPPSWP